jgi:hypothetical protein
MADRTPSSSPTGCRPSSAPAGSSVWSGEIIEEGDHDGLLARGGHYATLYNTYFRHQTLDYRPP